MTPIPVTYAVRFTGYSNFVLLLGLVPWYQVVSAVFKHPPVTLEELYVTLL